MILRLIIGIALCVVGFYFVRKPEVPLDLIGPIEFAEKVMTGGGSRSFYKLIGILIILVGFLAITNLHGKFIQWLVNFIG